MDREPAPEPPPPPIAESIDTVDTSIDTLKNVSLSTPKDKFDTDLQDMTPSRIKRILPRSPSSPRKNSELTPSRRDYRVLYEELKRKTLDYSQNMETKLCAHNEQIERMKVNSEQLKKDHDAEITKLKMEYENLISTKEQVLKEKTAELNDLKAVEEQREIASIKRVDGDELFHSRTRR